MNILKELVYPARCPMCDEILLLGTGKICKACRKGWCMCLSLYVENVGNHYKKWKKNTVGIAWKEGTILKRVQQYFLILP